MSDTTGISPIGFQPPSGDSDDGFSKKSPDNGLVLSTIMTANAKPATQMVEDTEFQSGDMDEDDLRLATMGYKQEMRRSIGLIGIISLSFSILSLPFAITTTLSYGLIAGGPVALIYSWILVTFATLALILSLAEICSRYPTAGSVYYWTAILAPRNHAPLYSWIAAWLNIVGELCGLAAIEFSLAQFIFGLVGVFHPDFVATAWQVVLLYWACLASSLIMNLPGGHPKYLDRASTFAMVWAVLGLLIIVPTLLGTCGDRHDAKYVFTSFDPSFTGFPSAWSWLLACMTPTYSMIAAGNVAALSEEVHQPEKQIPKAMWIPVALNGILGTFFLIGLSFVLPDIATLLSVPSGQPGPLMFFLVTGSKVATVFLSLLILGGCFGSGIFSAACLSRFIYGFARDGGVPGSNWLARIHPRTAIPVNALIAQSIVAGLLGLIYIGSAAAFNALLGCAIACLCASFMMPIALSAFNRRKEVKEAAFSLGKTGYIVNAAALLWGLLVLGISSSPLSKAPTASSMNYASVFFVFFAVVSGVWYLAWGRRHFKGPNVTKGFH